MVGLQQYDAITLLRTLLQQLRFATMGQWPNQLVPSTLRHRARPTSSSLKASNTHSSMECSRR